MNSIRKGLVASIAGLTALTAFAEPELNGEWKAKFATESSKDREATVQIDGLVGTWTTRPRPNKDKNDACIGRPLPMTLADSGSSTVTVRIEASKAVAGCKDRQARLTLVNANTLEGEFDNGRVVQLERVTR